ncbi:uncharacterized protein K460DRAFT_278401 [Cucurbitaria berberidis CBS 394.84]|uniref:Capsule polysaccharide biosynthesis protein n=1 Tax=Cucurbitaria berberidis CBS 394.84 TaxID=1168544 RepID=A0A9P4LB23_9PLEO|nr:uncharacterized protein K460DRAFT_278401 [Cucurbitaria berberidis CBS 394.84]KAF1847774.1 hypothetical protein K460DRAFT_278401 [Cucurbitaria berberidis CBS 394.84]
MMRNSGAGGGGGRGRCGGADGARPGTTSGSGERAGLWMDYPHIPGTAPLPYDILPPIPHNDAIPISLTSPQPPIAGSKSIFAFWHSGIATLPPYLLRNVIAWHRRFSPLGWTIYVLDTVPNSALNVSNFIDTASPSVVPAAFTDKTLNGNYAAQHTSDLIRYPLLLKYGGIYLDVGILQFGDLNWLWTEHIANPDSPYDFAGFTMGDPPDIQIVNFALMCGPNNPLVRRAHYILLKLWEGKTNTTGMHSHPLVSHVPLMRVPQEVQVDDEEQGKMVINDAVMTDYAIQIQCMGSAQHWLDEDDSWDGPKYVREKCWLLSMMNGAFAHEQMTSWSGQRQFELLKLAIPNSGEKESEDQVLARKIVGKLVADSWCLKLGHGFSAKLFGADTLGMLWRKHDGGDCGHGTYAGWLRWAEVSCRQSKAIEPMKVPVYEHTMKGKLLQ